MLKRLPLTKDGLKGPKTGKEGSQSVYTQPLTHFTQFSILRLFYQAKPFTFELVPQRSHSH